ncbi:hypothetical protein CaCOL14_013436 [Colletotrichum acutatum]
MFSANSAAKSGLVSAALVFADSSVMEEPVRIKERKICLAVSWFANANATSISTLPGLVIAGSSSLRWLVKRESEQKSKEDAKGEVKKDAAEDKPTDKPVPTPSPPAQKFYDSDGDSSDSPIEDWDELYSDDDMNATCIVGVRVYSMDEDLEVRVVMEGGELIEGGKKGEADIDNAQVNAGGEREKLESDSTEDAKPDVNSSAVGIAEEATEEPKGDKDKTNGDSKSDRNSIDSTEYDKLHSGTLTPDSVATWK